MKKLILVFCLSVLSYTILASNNSLLPKNCVANNFKFDKQQLILNTSKSKSAHVFLIHNISKQNFWLNHPIAHPSASAGWASRINKNQWSALMIDQSKKDFVVSCTDIQAGSVQKFSCEKLLQVCELENVNFKTQMTGSFWLAENETLNNLLNKLRSRGLQW